MPISGGKIPNQIGICKHLLGVGYQPGIILGSSGGAITGALLISAGVSEIKDSESFQIFCDNLKEVLDTMNRSWYGRPWSEICMLNSIVAMARGSVFDRGNGADVICRYLSRDLSPEPEFWIGTHNRDTNSQLLFCTKRAEEASLQIHDACYMDNDVDEIVQAVIASSAVPTLVPSNVIRGQTLCDGGVSFASPLGPCTTAYEDKHASYHVVYISPTRYSTKDDPTDAELEADDVWNQFTSSTSGMGRELHLGDRNNGIRLVGANCRREVGQGRDFLRKALRLQKNAARSFIELAPINNNVHVNFMSMGTGELYQKSEEAYKAGFSVRHWYVMPQDVC